jgi:2-oxoglutarate/2-oxoacid ferredoxin oxidoreductase subunit alpha
MTRQELGRFDGRDGRPAYIAYKGKIYDVSESPLWQGGEHEGLHRAGADLTPMLEDAPHGEEVFARYPMVGTLDADTAADTTPETAAEPPDPQKQRRRRWQVWYRKYHPHPMAVHFPIAFHLFAAAMDLYFLAEPEARYATAVFYTFFAATVMGAVAMVPGIISWQINYRFSMQRPFVVKVTLSTLMLFAGIAAIWLYLEDPKIVYTSGFEGLFYHAVVLLTGAGVIVLGYYGGKITWGESMPTNGHAAEAAVPKKEAAAERPAAVKRGDTAALPAAGRYAPPDVSDISAPPVVLPRHERDGFPHGPGNGIAILIGGAAGTGIDTLEKILSESFKRSGYYLFSTKEFMSRVRGGSNTTLLRVSDTPVEAPCWDVDLFFAIDAPALAHARARCTPRTLILADESIAASDPAVTPVAMKATAQKLGNPRYANTYAAGAVYGVLGLDTAPLMQSVSERFKDDEGNAAAARAGTEAGRALDASALPPMPPSAASAVAALHVMDGTTAAGFGFMAGGCNFVAAYPMSPSTGVLNFMASQTKRFEIALEQSEDEIASLTLVLGAWYAGARALTTTSGGGFALMGEALSLSGMTETPAVIYLAQRPGPATGLPTRSEQGDLNLALHSGHGPFPRILLAPGSLQECIDLGYLAFEMADRHQVPVIFLSDQYLADSMAMIGPVDFSAFEQRRYLAQTAKAYRRYEEAPTGVSPRGVPGWGDGLVCASSDEHDARGQITEDAGVRDSMVAKRARKAGGIVAEALPPERVGEGSIAVIGWGSTRGAIAEAISGLNDTRTMQVHFCWVHPLNPEHLVFLGAYDYRIVVENNADGAFAERLKLHGVTVDAQVLQSNGFPFFADQLAQRLATILKELA